jgi:DNA-binding beta-propeller fold protein YncE
MRGLITRLLALAVVSAFAFGCAAPLPELFWPEPPNTPRVKYIKSYSSAKDLTGRSAASDLIFGPSNPFRLGKPQGVFSSKDNKLYITDTGRSDVFIFDLANKKATSLKKMRLRGLYKPIGVVTDSTGRIFVSDSQSDRVHVVNPDGTPQKPLKPEKPFKQPTGLALDEEQQRLYVVDTHRHNVQVFDLETLEPIQTIGRRGNNEGEFNFPSNVAVGPNGRLYVVDTMNGRVQGFDNEGRFILTFGQFGDIPGMFARPKGVAVDSEGHVYVVDSAFNNVQVFNDEGQILMHFSKYGGGRGDLILPSGIAIDGDDFIYVADSWNARIVTFEFLGKKHKERTGKGGGEEEAALGEEAPDEAVPADKEPGQ